MVILFIGLCHLSRLPHLDLIAMIEAENCDQPSRVGDEGSGRSSASDWQTLLRCFANFDADRPDRDQSP